MSTIPAPSPKSDALKTPPARAGKQSKAEQDSSGPKKAKAKQECANEELEQTTMRRLRRSRTKSTEQFVDVPKPGTAGEEPAKKQRRTAAKAKAMSAKQETPPPDETPPANTLALAIPEKVQPKNTADQTALAVKQCLQRKSTSEIETDNANARDLAKAVAARPEPEKDATTTLEPGKAAAPAIPPPEAVAKAKCKSKAKGKAAPKTAPKQAKEADGNAQAESNSPQDADAKQDQAPTESEDEDDTGARNAVRMKKEAHARYMRFHRSLKSYIAALCGIL